MMILIADSGATSTKWCLESDSVSKSFYTEGLNPYYHTTATVTDVLNEKLISQLESFNIDEIHFYGAGCDTPVKKQTVYKALNAIFPDSKIKIEHDLLGSARACFFEEPGIACILGTGSNSCLYDGKKIVEHIPSLAFILGDEGSAGYLGKKLINSYFHFQMPDDLRQKLEHAYNMDLDYIMDNVYEGSQPSRFTASYAKFLGEHRDHPYVNEMLREGFHTFITRIIKQYCDAASYRISFVGSVAYAYEDLIRETLRKEDLTAGSFYRNPLERLVEYHMYS